MSEDMICGRIVTVHPARPANWAANRKITFNGGYKLPKREPLTKYTVDGVNHRNGAPIRFKSRDNAERHIRNMGLARD